MSERSPHWVRGLNQRLVHLVYREGTVAVGCDVLYARCGRLIAVEEVYQRPIASLCKRCVQQARKAELAVLGKEVEGGGN